MLLHKQQQEDLDSHVKVLTMENKEKENVFTYLELVNLNNVFLLQSKELRRKTTKVEKEKFLEEKEY